MTRFRIQFTYITLLSALAAAPAFMMHADSCNTSCDTDSCATSCSTNNDCNNDNDCNNGCSTCHTIIATRPTHSNTAYRYLPFADADLCEFNGGMTIGYMFNQTFNPCSLAQCAVGANSLTFKGSQVAGRNNAKDLVADYFGLSPLFVGTLKLCPQVRNHSLKFESLWDFAGWAEGLYLRADLTFSHQERSLFNNDCTSCLTDTTISNTSPFPAGYMGTGSVAAFGTIQQALAGTGFGDVQPWKFGKFKFCKQSTNKIDGFSLDLGYDFIRSDDSHFGIFLRYVAPTGTKIDAAYNEFFFAPLVGNMHHNELGGGLNAHKELWANDCGDSLTVHLDGYATHLFDDCQVRSFDFNATTTSAAAAAALAAASNSCNSDCDSDNNCSTTSSTSAGCLSRYTLLKQLTPATSGTAGYTATGVDIAGINFATRNVTSSIGVQGEASLRFIYRHNGFSMQFGYNIFGRQEEKLCFRQNSVPCSGTDNAPFNENFSYGFKGCNGDYYYVYPVSGSNTAFTTTSATGVSTLSNATSSNASITTCGTIDNPATTIVGTTTASAAGVDYKQAYNTLLPVQANAVPNGTANTSLTIAQTSAAAVALSNDPNIALNINSGRAARLVTNKGFITLDYTWECCDWQPFVSLGGEVEGGSNACDFKQWGVWLKGGFSF